MVAGEAGLPVGLRGRQVCREKQRAPRGEDMKTTVTTVQRRIALLAGLLLLSLLVFATGIQAAQAAIVTGTGAGSGTTATPVTIQDSWVTAANTAPTSQSVAGAAATPQDGWLTAANTAARDQNVAQAVTAPQDGWLTAANTAARNQDVAQAGTAPVSGAQTVSADTSSTTAWIAVGSAAAVLLVGFAAWALIRRRRQPDELASAAYCAQHPEDPLCSAV